MRILIVLHQFYPEFSGGTERVALNLARSAQRAGHHVRILACAVSADVTMAADCQMLPGAKETVYQGVPLTLLARQRLPASADFSLEIQPELVQPIADWMTQQQYDLVHVMHTMRMSTAVLAAQRCHLPLVLTLTDFFLACSRINMVDLDNRICGGPEEGKRCSQRCLTSPWSPATLLERHQFARELLEAASVRVAPSHFVADRYRSVFPSCDFQVIPHGIDFLALHCPQAPDKQALQQTGKLRLAYVGGVIPQKGLDLLLRALALVRNMNLKLKVIGGFHGSGAYHEQVLALGKADSRVEFVGHLDPRDLIAELQQVDLLCLPSRVPETFSLVLHEAAALGIPALVSDLGAPAELVNQHGSGMVLPHDDIDDWAKAIEWLAQQPDQVVQWRDRLPLPLRVEEECFYYDSLYRTLLHANDGEAV